MKKRFLSLVMVLAMGLSLISMQVSAEGVSGNQTPAAKTYQVKVTGGKAAVVERYSDRGYNIKGEWSEALQAQKGQLVVFRSDEVDGKDLREWIVKTSNNVTVDSSARIFVANENDHYPYITMPAEDVTAVPLYDTWITELEFNFTEPKAGAVASYEISVPEADQDKYSSLLIWAEITAEEEFNNLTRESVFEAEHDYVACVYVIPKEGYTVWYDSDGRPEMIKINGIENPERMETNSSPDWAVDVDGNEHAVSYEIAIPYTVPKEVPQSKASYAVRHFEEKLDAAGTYVLKEEQTLEGIVGSSTEAAAKTYAGFTAQDFEQDVITEDSQTVVEIRYDRNRHDLKWNLNGGTASGTYSKGTMPFGAKITAPSAAKAGFTFDGWSEEYQPGMTMPDKDLTIQAKWKAVETTDPESPDNTEPDQPQIPDETTKPEEKPDVKPEETKPVKIPFTDVKADDYYSDAVRWAVEKKITNGMTETTFAPDSDCTRAQIVTFLWRNAGCPEPAKQSTTFTDLEKDAYYQKAVLWAAEAGITNGVTATSFDPEGRCTRGQVAAFIWRAAGKPSTEGLKNPFTDNQKGTSYYDAICWAASKGITNGTSETTFSPEDYCTRGQIVTLLYRQETK